MVSLGELASVRWNGIDGCRRDRYLTAATYLSSRAFPSKLLQLSRIVSSSGMDTFDEGEESHPVLLPGIDLFNRSHFLNLCPSTPS
jgi:hypothetical protein